MYEKQTYKTVDESDNYQHQIFVDSIFRDDDIEITDIRDQIVGNYE